jgi:DNA-binding NtrC family response regulator
MDAGIATEANLVWLVERGYRYLVVRRGGSRQPVIPPELLFEENTPIVSDNPDLPLGNWQAHQERDYILRVLQANDWHVQDTARLLCISRKTLWENEAAGNSARGNHSKT